MRENKAHNLYEEVSNTLACTAFAEAGEPCPICRDKTEKEPGGNNDAKVLHGHPIREAIENDLACAAFAEAGEPCPICQDHRH